jgi:hypothetical protein
MDEQCKMMIKPSWSWDGVENDEQCGCSAVQVQCTCRCRCRCSTGAVQVNRCSPLEGKSREV